MIEKIRLDKLLSNLGLCTRSKVQSYINQNKVTYQGQRVSPKSKVNVDDIRIMGQKVEYPNLLTIAINKPSGYVCSNSREEGDHKIVYDLLPKEFSSRIPTLSVAGRLDKWVTGLVLMSQDGKIVERIITPKDDKMGKVYEVVCSEKFHGREEAELASGQLMLRSETDACKPAKFEVLDDERNMARLTLYEGKYHQVRRMMSAMGNKVVGINRTQVGPIQLGDLEIGKWRILSNEEIEKLEQIQTSKSAITKKLYKRKIRIEEQDDKLIEKNVDNLDDQDTMMMDEDNEETMDMDLDEIKRDEEYQRKLDTLIAQDSPTSTKKPLNQYKTIKEMENTVDDEEIPENETKSSSPQDEIVDERMNLTRGQIQQRIRDQVKARNSTFQLDDIGRRGQANSPITTPQEDEETINQMLSSPDYINSARIAKKNQERLEKLYGVRSDQDNEQEEEQEDQGNDKKKKKNNLKKSKPRDQNSRSSLIRNLRRISK